MMARILTHKPDPGNGIGLHYSRFRRYFAFLSPRNQLLAPDPGGQNRYYRPPIREVGLGENEQTASSERQSSPARYCVREDRPCRLSSGLESGASRCRPWLGLLMFHSELCPEPIPAALIQINGNRSYMRKIQHRLVGRGEDRALQGATIRLKTKPAGCGRARRAYPMISIP